jgi:hypothetical protein
VIDQRRDTSTLRQQIEEARALLHELPSADLGKLLNPILPAVMDGPVPFWSTLLFVLIRDELRCREADGTS